MESRFQTCLREFESLAALDEPTAPPECRTLLLTHAVPTQRAFLLLHGFTNCPAQLSLLAKELHLRGHNVLVPLAEGHGRADGSPAGLSVLEPPSLTDRLSVAVRVAAGLGDELTVVGFSFGGVLGAWAACNLDDVHEVVLLSPAFAPAGHHPWSARILPALIRLLPERELWWDPVRRAESPGSPYSYRKLSRRGIGAVFELGMLTVLGTAQRSTPIRRAVLLLNDNDPAISARVASHAFSQAITPLAERSEVVHLAAQLRLPHDYLDPYAPNADKSEAGRRLVIEILCRDVSETGKSAERHEPNGRQRV